MQRRFLYSALLFLMPLLALLNSCKKKDYAIPTPKSTLQNDLIKRTLGPNIVGQRIEFAYAMAILPEKGKLVSAQVEASIPGAAGTFLENNSYYTNGGGSDVPVLIGQPSVTNGAITTVNFSVDTSAATLRYYYVIPPEAKGKTVSFTFSAKSSNGETVSYKAGPYAISKMDMIRNLTVSDNNNAYISIADLAVYNAAAAAANPDKIDLVYLYRNLTTSAFNHALVSPTSDTSYLPGVSLPAGLHRNTRMRKVFNLQDFNLAQEQYGIYIDDVDFQQIDLNGEPDYAINLKAEAGVWLETSDHKYRAYIFINSINNGTKSMVISIKRYAL